MLPQLNSDPNAQVNVQQTAFSLDVLGRWVCSSWAEVSGNGGDPFDVVVIGAGMFGGYIADKVYRRGDNLGLRTLIVEAGSFLLPTHVQNLPRMGLNAPGMQVAAAWVWSTKLRTGAGRFVALKFLPEDLAQDQQCNRPFPTRSTSRIRHCLSIAQPK